MVSISATIFLPHLFLSVQNKDDNYMYIVGSVPTVLLNYKCFSKVIRNLLYTAHFYCI